MAMTVTTTTRSLVMPTTYKPFHLQKLSNSYLNNIIFSTEKLTWMVTR